jgi:TPR repeat protein
MANREELLIIRSARSGQANAQLALGKRYLFGGSGLPQSHATALHWLEKAAEQNLADAWFLIGEHVPFEIAQQSSDPLSVAVWYERAFEGGMAKAGLILAMLVFASWSRADQLLRQKAMRALHAAAESGLADAQWLLAQQLGMADVVAQPKPAEMSPAAKSRRSAAIEWSSRAARGGVMPAQRAVADYFWGLGDQLKFLFWALPIAQSIERRAGSGARRRQVERSQLDLINRCATALMLTKDPNSQLVERYLKLAAEGGDSSAQLSYGLWIARMDEIGQRVSSIPGVAHYKKAIRWLSLAADQGVAAAWYAMSRIYLKPEFSRRSITEARRYLEMAAVTGHVRAQLELGLVAWRSRKLEKSSDIRAVYWLQKAAGMGSREAKALLERIAPPVRKAEWAHAARTVFNRDTSDQYPFLAARVELGYWFGLTRAEALLVDIEAADHGHCLEVDIRDQHPRSRRRLVQIATGEQRAALDRVARMFGAIEAKGVVGQEGNYRQRLYRFRSLMTQRRAQRGASPAL